MSRNILKSTVSSALFNIVFQMIFRCISFILNAFIIRNVGYDVMGIMNVRLLLLESTILFLSKEPILKACLTNTESHNWTHIINQVWLSVPFTAVLGVILSYLWIDVLSPIEDKYVHQYTFGCYSIVLSCIVEQLSQNAVIVGQNFCFVRLKVIIETLYVIFRTATFVIFVVYDPKSAIIAFSLAQVTSAIFLSTLYYGFFTWYIPNLEKFQKEKNLKYFSKFSKDLFSDMVDFPFKSIRDFFPKKVEQESLNKNLLELTLSFAKQSIIKQVLTEGEKYIMTLLPLLTFAEQSIYDIINNLGSLAARFIFRPIEESTYFYFTQMIKRDVPLKDQDKVSVSQSVEVLSEVCKIVTSIGFLIFVFGQSYSYTLLYLYGGENFVKSDLPVTLLKTHCFAIVLLALNGITEGFVFAAMSNKQIDRYNYILVVFSIAFLILSYGLTYAFGPVGFILANCFNMLIRIVRSILYILDMYKHTNHRPLNGLKPSWKFVLALIISGISTKISEVYCQPHSIILHIGVGFSFFFITVLIWCHENSTLLKLGYNKYKRRLSSSEEL